MRFLTHQRNCPECGSDPFKTQDYDKITREMNELSSRFKRALASHGLVRAEWDLKEIELTEGMKWLQRKAKKQAQTITKLEDKLKKFGEQPYKEESPEEFTIKTMAGKIVVEEK